MGASLLDEKQLRFIEERDKILQDEFNKHQLELLVEMMNIELQASIKMAKFDKSHEDNDDYNWQMGRQATIYDIKGYMKQLQINVEGIDFDGIN